MVVINHVEKIAPSKVTVTMPAPVKEEQAKPETKGERTSRKANKED